MTIPTAVSPSTLTPGVYVTVDLTAGAGSPGTGVLRTFLAAPKASTGDLTVDTEIRTIGSPQDAATAFGPGTPGHLAAKLIYAKHPTAQIDVGAPTAGAGTATVNITPTGVPTSDTSVTFVINGVEITTLWLASETVAQFIDRAVVDINAKDNDVPVTAVDGTTFLTLNFKVTGNIGNDCRVKANLNLAQTGSEAIDTNTLTNLAGGSAEPDFSTLLSNATGVEYHYIVPCLSNADAQDAGGTSNPARIETHINSLNSGLLAKLQQAIYASTGTIALAKTGAIARNEGTFEHVDAVNAQSLPSEIAAREAGGRLAAISLDPAANRIGEVLDGIFGSEDVIADRPTLAESEDALGNGVAIVSYTANGDPVIARPITTYSQDSTGAPDRRLLDVQNVDATYIVIRDIRDALPQEFPNAKISKDVLAGEEPPPEGVVEERDVRSFVIGRLRFWARRGVVQTARLEEAIEDGSLIVRVNPSDETQVDLVLPFKIVQPLAKFGVVGQRLAS